MPENVQDKGYKRLLSKKRNFVSLLTSFVDEAWVSEINENDLELMDKEFVPQDFREKEADIIYKLKVDNREIIFYCLLELQSTVDHTMPFRLLVYMVELMKRLFMDEDKKIRERASYRLPAIVPMVLYNGTESWTAVKSFKEYMSGHEAFNKEVLNFNYILLNINQYTDETLKETGNLISSIFSLDKDQPLNAFVKNWREVLIVFMKLSSEEQTDLMDWVRDVLQKKVSVDKRSMVGEILENLKRGEVTEMTYAIERLWDKVEQEGIEKGIEKGREESKLEDAINIVKEFNATVTKALEVTNLSGNDRVKIIEELKRQNIPYTD